MSSADSRTSLFVIPDDKTKRQLHQLSVEVERLKAKYDLLAPNQIRGRKMGSVDSKNNTGGLSALNIPGMKHVMDSQRSKISKLLWTSIIFFNVLICFYQICNRVQLYIDTPTIPILSAVRNQSVKFPSITMCSTPENQVPLLKLQKQYAAARNKSNFCHVNMFDLIAMNVSLSTIWDAMSTDHMMNRVYVGRLRDSGFGPTYKRHLKVSSVKTLAGTCSTYSLAPLVPFQKEDFKMMFITNGLPSLNCGQDEAYKFMFHEDNEDVRHSFITTMTLMPYGYTRFGITARQFKFLDTKNNRCSSGEMVDKCRSECIERMLEKQGLCRLPYMSNWKIPECDNERSLHESMHFVNNLYNLGCNCPRRCQETVYKLNFKESSTGSGMLATLDIYFEDNTIDILTEVYSYSLVAMLCEIGGNLGLYLGLCILSFLEILESFVFYIRARISGLCK